MAIPCPGPAQISLLDLQNEFGGSSSIGLNEYYRNGAYVSSNNTQIPTSGTISLADFFCAQAVIIRYITTTTINANASSYFTTSEWQGSSAKILIINPGVIVGSTDVSSYALTVPSGFGGSFKLINNGSIQGAGGAANGGNGGSALFVGSPITVDNLGSIYAGGGGGGNGGQGGQGIYSNFVTTQGCGGKPGCPAGYYETGTWQGRCCQSYSCGWNECCSQNLQGRYCRQDVVTNGGGGGAGGRGQGYGVSAVAGTGGSAGGINAGTGGAGGNGGSWGVPGYPGINGSNGNYTAGTAGTLGGLSGYYVVNNQNITWINTGERLGRAIESNTIVARIGGAGGSTLNLNYLDIKNIFGISDWQSGSYNKNVIFNSGVYVGSTNSGIPAITVSSGLGAVVTITNSGYILGAGGVGGGAAQNGGQGGTAIYAAVATTINNLGYIYGGGGGAGGGGYGGNGYYTYECNCGQCVECFNEGSDSYYCNYFDCCDTCSAYPLGGAGGNGGRGQGFDGGRSSGAGGAGADYGGGTGGTGGTGGLYGSPGQNGNIGSNGSGAGAPGLGQSYGPGYGGAAGYYILGNSRVTWQNTGSRLGGAVG